MRNPLGLGPQKCVGPNGELAGVTFAPLPHPGIITRGTSEQDAAPGSCRHRAGGLAGGHRQTWPCHSGLDDLRPLL